MIALSPRDPRGAADDEAFELGCEFAFTDEPSSELARQDSNLDNLDQNQVCYRYTTGQIDEPDSSAGGGRSERAISACDPPRGRHDRQR